MPIAQKSFRNLTARALPAGTVELNTYDVLNSDVVVFTSDVLPTGRACRHW